MKCNHLRRVRRTFAEDCVFARSMKMRERLFYKSVEDDRKRLTVVLF